MDNCGSAIDLSDLKFTAVKVDLSSLTTRRKHQIVVISTLTTAAELTRMVAVKANMHEKQAPLMRLVAEIRVKVEGRPGQEETTEVKFTNHQKPLKIIDAYPKDSVRLYLQWKTDEELAREKDGAKSLNQSAFSSPRELAGASSINQSAFSSPRDYLMAWNQAAIEGSHRQRSDSLPSGSQRYRRPVQGGPDPYPGSQKPSEILENNITSTPSNVAASNLVPNSVINTQIIKLNADQSVVDCDMTKNSSTSRNSMTSSTQNLMMSSQNPLMTPAHNSVTSRHTFMTSPANKLNTSSHNKQLSSSSNDVALLAKKKTTVCGGARIEAPPARHHVEMVNSDDIRRAKMFGHHKTGGGSKMAAVSKWASFAGLSRAVEEFPDYRPTRNYAARLKLLDEPLVEPTDFITGEAVNFSQDQNIEKELLQSNQRIIHPAQRDGGGSASTGQGSNQGDRSSDVSSTAACSDPGVNSLGSGVNSEAKPSRRHLPELSISDEAVEKKLNVLSAKLEKKLLTGGNSEGKRSSRQTSRTSSLASSSILHSDETDHKLERTTSKKESSKRWSMNDADILSSSSYIPSDLLFIPPPPPLAETTNDAGALAAGGGKRRGYDYDDTMSVTSMEVANILSRAEPLAPPCEADYEKPPRSVLSDVEDEDLEESAGSLDHPEGLSSSDESHSDYPSLQKPRHRQNVATRNRVTRANDNKNFNGLKTSIVTQFTKEHHTIPGGSIHSNNNSAVRSIKTDSKAEIAKALHRNRKNASSLVDSGKTPFRKFPGPAAGGSSAGGAKDVLTLHQILQTRAPHCVTAQRQSGGRQLAFEVFNDVIYLETVVTSSGSSSSSLSGGAGRVTREIARKRFTLPVVGEVHTSRQWLFSQGELNMGDIIVEINGESVLGESAMQVIDRCNRTNELRIVVARPRPALVDHGTSMRSLKQ